MNTDRLPVPPPEDHWRSSHIEKTNRLSVGAVRFMLWVVVIAHVGLVLALLLFLWEKTSPGTVFIVGIMITAIWVAWLRQVEFTRFTESHAPPPTQRFRSPNQ